MFTTIKISRFHLFQNNQRNLDFYSVTSYLTIEWSGAVRNSLVQFQINISALMEH